MLVEKYKLGNTEIEIHDDAYKDKTQEDIERILRRLEEIGRKALYKKAVNENKLKKVENI